MGPLAVWLAVSPCFEAQIWYGREQPDQYISIFVPVHDFGKESAGTQVLGKPTVNRQAPIIFPCCSPQDYELARHWHSPVCAPQRRKRDQGTFEPLQEYAHVISSNLQNSDVDGVHRACGADAILFRRQKVHADCE